MRFLTNPETVSTIGSLPLMCMMCLPDRKKFAPTFWGWFVVIVLCCLVGPVIVVEVATHLGWMTPEKLKLIHGEWRPVK
jgi:hypothetical protein